MNDTLYEAGCEYTYDIVREITTHTRKSAYVVYCAVLYAVLVIIEYRYIFVYKKYMFATIIGVAMLGIAIYFFMIPVINAKKQYKDIKNMYDGENMYTKVYIYEDGVEHINEQSQGHVHIKYENVKRIIETKNLYILMIKGNVAVAMDKKKFTKGSPESLPNFIGMKIAS